MADVESKSIPHVLPSSHWLKATGQCVLERYLSGTMLIRKILKRKLNGEKKHSGPIMFTYFPKLSRSDANPAGDQSHSVV